MTDLIERDYFTDFSILKDPYAYFEAVRAKGPIHQLPNGIVVVTGFDETLQVLKRTDDFSSANAPQGAGAPLPFTPEGSDISAQIEAHRSGFVGGDLIVAWDGQKHSFARSLLAPLFTPSRLKASHQFIADYSDELVKTAVAKGGCDLIEDIATLFVTMVIADLLGVPDDDRHVFMDAIAAGVGAGSLNSDDLAIQNQPLVIMGQYFAQYVLARRQNPCGDVMSELANATYPDGSKPDAMEVVMLSTFLFAAGQDTSAKLLGNTMKYIVDQPGLQAQLRADPSLITPLLEEVLRLEGSTKVTARVAKHDTQLGDLKLPAGTKILIALSAANRDPRRWENPQELVLNRPRIKEHLAFGRGAHVCAGAPLARVEVRVILEKFLEHTAHIELDSEKHGPAGARDFDYEPSFIIRGLNNLHLKLTPAEGFVAPEPKAPKAKAQAEVSADAGYSTATTKVAALLADAAAKAVLDKHFPGMTADPQFAMASSMTLRAIQQFAPGQFSNEQLDAVDADLAQLVTA